MDRGLRAQLSPKEENALRKIAAGVTDKILAIYLMQLVALQLIEARDGAWRLTEMGRARMAASDRGVGAPPRFPPVSSASAAMIDQPSDRMPILLLVALLYALSATTFLTVRALSSFSQ